VLGVDWTNPVQDRVVVVDYFEHGNEYLDSIKRDEFVG
jgi:hypothetical protein